VLGQAHTKTGITQSNWVDTAFRSHERHPKASRDRAGGCQPRPATGGSATRASYDARTVPAWIIDATRLFGSPNVDAAMDSGIVHQKRSVQVS